MTVIESMKFRGVIPRAALYARFSSDNQREESIDAQLRAMREYCLRNNVVIANEYCDHARSATTDDRPEFQRLIRESKNCEFNIVIVHKLDRFSRDRYDSAYYKRELKRSGVSLISVLENLDDSPESIILESVLEGMSEYYSRNLAREVMKGMRESALQCRAVGGCAPFGYKINPETKRYEIEEDEIDAVRMIFDKVLEGVGYGDIIHDLNSMGYLTRGGKPFGKNSLHEILRNEKYRGVYIFNRVEKKDVNRKRNNHRSKNPEEMIRIEGGVPQIIDDKVWEGVQAILNSRTKHRVSNNSGKETYLLTGKIICGECGHSFTGVRLLGTKQAEIRVLSLLKPQTNHISRLPQQRNPTGVSGNLCHAGDLKNDLRRIGCGKDRGGILQIPYNLRRGKHQQAEAAERRAAVDQPEDR